MEDESVFQELAAFLNTIGLGSLFVFGSDGKPSGWLWEQIVGGIDTQEQLLFALEKTPEFQQRFPVIFEMRNRAMKGEATYVPTVADVLNYERDYVREMTAAGVPSWFYDSVEDAHRAMRSNLSVTQVADRIERGYGVMQRMPREVKDAFAELYGNDSEGVLLAAVLDPQKTLEQIDRSVRTAQISGFGRRAGLEVTAEQAQRFAENPLDAAQIQRGIQTAAEFKPLTDERIGEAGMDINQEVALSAGLTGSAADQQLLESRLTRRQLEQRTVGGGAVAGQSGISGAGVA